MASVLVHEQTKLLATAVNNVGTATITAGAIVPTVGYFYGSLHVDDPLRLLSLVFIYLVIVGFLLSRARGILEGLA